MNNEANRLGLKNTFFINPSGLDPINPTKQINYSTVEDLVIFIKYLLKNNNNLFWNILSTKEVELYEKKLVNTNKLLGEIPSIVGGRTGWTIMAGGSLILVLEVTEDDEDSASSFHFDNNRKCDEASVSSLFYLNNTCNEGYLINIILGTPTPESRFEEMKKMIKWTKKLK